MPKGISLVDGDFAIKILSWYLWGQEKAPKPEELADAKWIDRKGNIELEYSTVELLEKAGEFVNAKDFKLFEVFFSGKTNKKSSLNNGNKQLTVGRYEKFEDGKYYLTQEQFVNLFYNDDDEELRRKARNPETSVYLYNRALLDEDFAKVAFLFGSITVGLDTDKIRYVLDENLNPICVENVKYKFNVGDFDYESNSTIANIVNWVLKQTTDPSNIGKKVLLKPIIDMTPKKDGTPMEDATINVGTIGQLDYFLMGSLENVQIPTNSIDAEIQIYKLVMEALAYYFEYKDIKKSGVINYLDENGKLVIYDASQSNIIIGTHAKNFDFADNVEIKLNKNTKFSIPLAIFNHYKDRIPNGITYIGGAGADIIAGTKYDDILYGHDRDGKNDDGAKDVLVGDEGSDRLYGGQGEDTLIGSFSQSVDDDTADELYGGDGYDTYYAGNKDIINDLDGAGKVFFDNNLLIGGQYDKDRGVYIDINNANITYSLDEPINTLTVNKIENGKAKTLTIYNFHKNNSSLDITLLDADEIGISISDNQTNEGDSGKKSLDFNISLQGSIEKGEFLILGIGDKKYLFGDPSEEYIKKYNLNLAQYKRGNTYTYTWEGNTDKQEDREFDVTPTIIQTSDKLKAKILKHGTGKIIDDDRDPDDPETDSSPIVIDLNNDGINTLSLDYTRNFDLDNNGFAEATGWIQKDDALLAYDRNGNGKIDNGGELFGNYTLSDNYYSHTSGNTNGFNALKEFDTNNDGIIDKNDKDFDKLLLWQDKNSNAVTDEGELIKLSDKVKSIDLNYKEISTSNNGNSIRQISDATLNDGTKVKADDVWFKVSLNKTKEIIDQDKIPLETQALPQVIASGNLNSLRAAASKNKTLATMINLYLTLSSEDRKKHIDELIYEWVGVEAIDKNLMRGDVKARDMAVYEKLAGKPFLQKGYNSSPWTNASNRVNDKINTFKYYVYATIELQTTYSDLNLDMEKMSLEKGEKLSYKFDALNSRLIRLYKDGKYNEIVELMNIVLNANAYKPIFQEDLKLNLLNFCGNDDKLLSLCLNTYISGTDSNDFINGNSENNFINGGKGNDTLYGGYGNDMYVFDRGDGDDTIYDTAGDDKIQFGEGIAPNDISLKRELDKLILSIKSKDGTSSDSITIQNFFSVNPEIGNNTVRTIAFADRTVYDLNKILELTPLVSTDKGDKLYLTDGNDTFDGGLGNDEIWGGNGDDVINGNEGNDILYGNDGNDTLNGGEGNDILHVENGNNILIGGEGNDTLNGGYGDDTYIYNKGDGADTIIDYGGNNILKLGAGLDKKDLIISQNSNGYILLSFKDNASDSITLTSPNIQVVEFANGDKINIDEIKKLSLIGDDTDNTIYGYYNEDNTLIGNGGNDTLYGSYGNDTYIFNKSNGADTIIDHGGNDTIKFNDFSASDISLRREFRDVIITSKVSNDKIIIKDFYNNTGSAASSIKKIIFNDNSIWDYQTIINNSSIKATEESDKFYLSDKDDIFDALGGDDEIYGHGGNDILSGGLGGDKLYGNDGNDTLIGGKDDDILNGGYGDDTYIFNKGDDNDTVTDNGGADTIKFGEGISKEDLIVKRVARMNNDTKRKEYSDIAISFKNSPNDSITMQNVIDSNKNRDNNIIENFEFANGEKLSFEDIKKLSLIGTDSSENIVGFVHENNIIKGKGGDDKLYGQGWNDTIYGGDGSDLIEGGSGNDTLIGGKGNDILNGGIGNDILIGEADDDTIYGDLGDDILIGGIGKDTLNGGMGDDTYVFNKGDGNDTIEDSDGVDIIKFGERISKDDLLVSRDANNKNNIVIKFKNTATDSITLKNVISENKTRINNAIENFEFANGDKLSFKDIKQLSVVGTNEDEDIQGFDDVDNTLVGNGGSDKLYGGDGNDTLIGGIGNDILNGGLGNDTLIGDVGNDILKGGIGDDTYVFNKGDGNDIIEDSEGVDTLKFGEGIRKEDLIISRNSDKNSHGYLLSYARDIIIKFKHNETDSITLKNVINENKTDIANAIENFEFANGEKLSFEDIKQLPLMGTDEGEGIKGFSDSNNTLVGNGGNDNLYGDNKNDILIGGRGNDSLYGGGGDDTYIYNIDDGNDTIYDYEGEDIIKFGKGINKEDIIVTKSEVKHNSFTGSKYRDLVISFRKKQGSISLEHTISEDGSISVEDKYKTLVFENGDKLSFEDILKLSLTGDDEDNHISGYKYHNDTIEGKGGNDILNGDEGNDTLIGGEGNDRLDGGEGNDILIGGEGDDTLEGFRGDDAYIFNKGDGNDTIEEYSGNDTLKFGEGISKEDIIVKKSGYDGAYSNDIVISFKNNPTDSITLKDAIRMNEANKDKMIENFIFSNGDKLSFDDIRQLSLIGSNGKDDIRGYNDLNNIFQGMDGDDHLWGRRTDETFIGGKGNDYLIGGGGDDTYIFSPGDGNDIISDSEGTNTLQFTKGITKDDLLIGLKESRFIIRFKNSNDSIEFFHTSIKKIQFFNGDELTYEEMKKLALTGTDGDDVMSSCDNEDTVFMGGKGNDTLTGGSGNDTYIFNKGDGADSIRDENGNDTIKFGNGISKNDLIIKRSNNKDLYEYDDVIISFKNSPNDSIAIKNIIADNKIRPSGIIENFEFASGEKLSFEDIKQLSLVGTNKDDLIKGYNDMDNVIEGKAGNDTLIGANYYDSYGQKDGSYKNTFVFSKGDGADTIAGINNEDLIKFKDIGKNEVKFELNPANKTLLISNTVSNDTVLIEDYSTTSGYNYEKRRYFVTNLNIEFKDGITLNNDFILKNAKLKGDANTMIGGKEDNIFTYDGGAKTIMDLGGYDKVIYKNPVKRVRYDYGENGSDDLRLIITPADPNAKNDILEVKGFFSNRDNVIEEFRIGKYLNIKAADIYRAFGMDYEANNAKAASLASTTETFSLAAKPALMMNAKLDIDNEAQISSFLKSSDDVKPATLSPIDSVYSTKSDENEVSSASKETNELSLNSKSGWDMILGNGDKDELKAIVSKYCDDSNLSTSNLNSNLSVSNTVDLNSAPGVIQEDTLKDNAFLSQDTVNKIIEQLNVYADNSEALEFNQKDIRKDDMQVYMS